MIRKFPRILFAVMTVGYIFAIFSLFLPGKYIYGLISLLVASAINLTYLTSREYKALGYLNNTKNFIEKNKTDTAAGLIIKSAKLNEDEDSVNKFFSKPIKNIEATKNVASKLNAALKEYDTPYFRYITAGFYYTIGDLKKVVRILNEIPEEKRTIKIARLLGSTLLDLKETDKSIEVLSKFEPPFSPVNEDELAIVYGIGINYLNKGDKEKAASYLTKVEAKNPKFGNVSKILSKIKGKEK
jgi:tetratricopeptide (TPR) repeat protein